MATAIAGRIGALLAATVVALGVCELAARAVFPAPPDPTHQPQIVYLSDSQIRYVLEPNQRGWIDDGFVTTNSLGFRGREVEIPKPAGRRRLVFVGDSITFGWGVNDDQTFCAQTERLLRETYPHTDLDVVNLGVGGYETRQEVGLLKRNVARLQPDVVLVGFYSNDVPESLLDKNTTTDDGANSDVHEARRILHLNPAPTSWWDAEMRKSRAMYTTGRVLKQLAHRGEWGMSGFSMELDLLAGHDSERLQAAWSRVERQLEDLRSLANRRGFSVGIVMLPPREQVLGVYPKASYQKHVRAIADHLGFFTIDPLPALVSDRARLDQLFIPYDRNHPSAAGHRIVARAIVDQLIAIDALGTGNGRVAGGEVSH